MDKAYIVPLLTIISSTLAQASSSKDSHSSSCGTPEEQTARAVGLIQRETLALAYSAPSSHPDQLILDPNTLALSAAPSSDLGISYESFHYTAAGERPVALTAEVRCDEDSGKMLLHSLILQLSGVSEPLVENEILE